MRSNLKPLAIVAAILLSAANHSFSQQQNIVVSLSSGPVFTDAGQKSNRQGNGYSLHADGFMPFYRKGWDGSVKGSGFTLGINAGIDYTSLKNLQPGSEVIGEKYQVNNGTTNISNSKFEKYSGSFSASAGLQAQLGFGKLMISPIINAGYISVKQEGHTQTGNFSVNGQSFSKDLVKQDAVKESGFLIKPQLKLGYSVSDKVVLYLGSAFTAGPQMEYALHTLVPQGGVKDNNQYEADQIKNGTYTESKVKSRYQTSEIHLGISMGLGKGTRKKPRGKVTKPGDNGLSHITSNADSTKKPGGAVSSSYAAGRVVPTDSTKSNEMPNRLSMTPTTARQMHQTGNTDSSKNPLYEAGGHNGNNPVYNPAISSKPGSPIGGIVVKGGKNPGGNMISVTSNNNGEFELRGLETGNYQFVLTTPETPQGKSINEKGVKRNEAAEAARPGQPIKGVIVKGGKNPGGNMINLTVKEGTIQFDVLEAGNYKFIIQTPGNTNGNQSKKKVVEKATSGLKDTLKTNV